VTRPHRYVILNNIPIIALFSVLVAFVSFMSRGHTVFPDSWFPSQFAASAFMILFCVWILCELVNNIWSRMNSITTNVDKGSFRVVIVASWAAIFAVFIFRSFSIGIFEGSFQYVGSYYLLRAFCFENGQFMYWVDILPFGSRFVKKQVS